jgi:hypothetical protein
VVPIHGISSMFCGDASQAVRRLFRLAAVHDWHDTAKNVLGQLAGRLKGDGRVRVSGDGVNAVEACGQFV